MSANQERDLENPRREREMRAELIIDEMALAVRFLGGDGPADIADTIREAVSRHNEESLARAKHEAFIAKQQAAVAIARLQEIDPDFYGAEIDRLRRASVSLGRAADLQGGE